MKALILGGTTFLGRHLIRALVDRGHETAIFTRGRRPFEDDAVTRYRGDRDGDLGSLPRDGWDAVIDTSGYVPAIVAASCAHLARAGRYLFTSSISVYDPHAPVCGEGLSPYSERRMDCSDDDPENYGSSKRRCEDVVRAVFDDRALVVRPGVIAGAYDPTNRFTYWVDRFAEGGDVAIPGPPERYIQFIDAGDLASFMVHLLETGRSGIYDASCPQETVTMGAFVEALQATVGAAARPVWIDPDFLEARDIHGWSDLPLWLGPSYGLPGFMNVAVSRAQADGLQMRALRETIEGTRSWSCTVAAHGDERNEPAGITRERERDLLAAWSAASGQ